MSQRKSTKTVVPVFETTPRSLKIIEPWRNPFVYTAAPRHQVLCLIAFCLVAYLLGTTEFQTAPPTQSSTTDQTALPFARNPHLN